MSGHNDRPRDLCGCGGTKYKSDYLCGSCEKLRIARKDPVHNAGYRQLAADILELAVMDAEKARAGKIPDNYRLWLNREGFRSPEHELRQFCESLHFAGLCGDVGIPREIVGNSIMLGQVPNESVILASDGSSRAWKIERKAA